MIPTERLELVPATIPLLEAALSSDASLGLSLQAEVPGTWPPEHYDAETIRFSLNQLTQHPEDAGWGTYFIALIEGGNRRLVGFGGFKGPAAENGTVELGYSVVKEYQRRGLATEAVRGFLMFAFADSSVTRVIAETLPELIPSQGVLSKAGFTLTGPGSKDGVIRFDLTRENWASGLLG